MEEMFIGCCGSGSDVIEESLAAAVSSDDEHTTSPKPPFNPSLTIDTNLASAYESTDDCEFETGGMSEPPVTPVGRDELALRRHRFFADLMAASQTTHRVRFDPRGPSFSG